MRCACLYCLSKWKTLHGHRDYRKLNEIAISDEFPLPEQEDILQALEGSQWLSTLYVLAGFTQVEVEPKEREKLAFPMHQGLWQFIRMPFG